MSLSILLRRPLPKFVRVLFLNRADYYLVGGSTDCGDSEGFVIISSQGDLDSISNCQTIKGDLIIVPNLNQGLGNDTGILKSIVLPSGLQTVTGSIYLAGVYLIASSGASSIEASGLTSIGSEGANSAYNFSNPFFNFGLAVYLFPSLNSMAFPALKTIAGDLFYAYNEGSLNDLNFPQLSNVGGSLDLIGNFNSLELPDLSSVGGAVNIQSSSKSFTCPIPKFRTNGAVKGNGFVCEGDVAYPIPGVTGQNVTAVGKASSIRSGKNPWRLC
jgi:hypothetical protein